jgi:hypothetical protein
VRKRTPILRTSERRSAKRCPQQWYWAWRCGLRPIGQVSDALWFGTIMHAALALWYEGPGLKRGPHPAETFQALADEDIRWIKTEARGKADAHTSLIEERLVPAQELGVALMEDYVREYGTDDSWHVIQPEHSGQLNVMDPDEPKTLLAIYAFTYDLVFRDLIDDSIWIGEHKSAKAIRTDHLPLDDQAGSYWAVAPIELLDAGLIKPSDKLAGIMYNFVRKALADDRPRNAEGHYTNKPIKADYVSALIAAGINFVEQSSPKSGPIAVEKATLPDLQTAASFGRVPVFGEVSKLQPKPRFVREPVYRSQRERATQVRRIQDEAVCLDQMRVGALPIIKNPTPDCSWCPYHDMCVLDERGDKVAVQEYREAMYEVRDPYEDHRKSTEAE